MYDLQDWAAVQRVYKQTRSKRATAKILGMSRNTVRSLLEEKEAPVYKRTVYKSKIDGFKEQIIEWRCEPFLFNGTRIFRELKARVIQEALALFTGICQKLKRISKTTSVPKLL